jgi:Flp pilus assembly protein protease CpaA
VLEIICELSIALFAVACDLKNRKIPNKLCLYGVCSGFLLSLTAMTDISPVQSLAGIVIPVVLLWVLFVFRILGAGDIKLFCAIGSFAGIDIWKIICLSMIFGAAAGAVAVVRRLLRCLKSGGFIGFLDEGFSKICFSVPIAMGLLTFVIKEVFGAGIQTWNM